MSAPLRPREGSPATRLTRTALAWAAVLLAVVAAPLAGPAGAQGPSAPPPGDGAIRGTVLRDDDTAQPLPGLDVVLYALPPGGQPGLAHGVTDSAGRFAFDGVSTDPQTAYVVGVRADDVPFGERVAFEPGQGAIEIELRVTQPLSDTSGIEVGETFLRIDRGCSSLRVNESHQLRNPGDRVIYVPEAERAGTEPIFRARLPAEASDLAAAVGMLPQGLEQEGRDLRFWGPLYPGDQQLEFAYALPGAAGKLEVERAFPNGSPRVVFLTHVQGPVVRGAELAPGEGRTVEGLAYRAVEVRGLAKDASLSVEIEVPETPTSRLSLERVQMWLEIDDAALVADEQHQFQVEGGPLIAMSDAPLLCIPLPDGVEDLRFSNQALAMGLARDPSGELAVRGPVPPGQPAISLRYHMRATADGVQFSRRFPLQLPWLSIFVADTGVRIDTDRLHRRRSVQSNDRSFLHLEAFQIDPDEPVEIDFGRVPTPQPLPQLAVTGFALLAAAGTLYFLASPLRGGASERSGLESPAEQLAAEREATYAAIRDLEDDFETGKLTAEDYDALRRDLRTQAVRLLAAERGAASGAPAPAAAAAAPAGAPAVPAAAGASAGRCANCDAELADQARFCHRCGADQGNTHS